MFLKSYVLELTLNPDVPVVYINDYIHQPLFQTTDTSHQATRLSSEPGNEIVHCSK